ncbi:hypothetical protein BDZ89DRAFT_501186 [Hymenopellis radicata]|nr:hypothetical protein BDZ89DRAFT_501186 [Hymenopellis radicata]
MATGSSADPLDIPSDSDSVDVLTSDAASNASAEEQQSRGRRSRPTAVQKRGGARRSSPTWSPSRLNANKDRERTASSSPPPRRTGRASRPSEKGMSVFNPFS